MSANSQTLQVIDTLIEFSKKYGSMTSEELSLFKDLLVDGYSEDQAISQIILERM